MKSSIVLYIFLLGISLCDAATCEYQLNVAKCVSPNTIQMLDLVSYQYQDVQTSFWSVKDCWDNCEGRAPVPSDFLSFSGTRGQHATVNDSV